MPIRILNAGGNPVPTAFQFAHLANRFTESVYAQLLSRQRLSRSEFTVLFCLNAYGESTAPSVYLRTGRPGASVDKAVTAMLDQACVMRRENPDDRLSPLLSLTRRGLGVVEAALPLFTACEAAMLAPLSRTDRVALTRILAKLSASEGEWSTETEPG